MSLTTIKLFDREGAALATSYPTTLATGEEWGYLGRLATVPMEVIVVLDAGQTAVFKLQGTLDNPAASPVWLDLPTTRQDTIVNPQQVEHTLSATGAIALVVPTAQLRAVRCLAKVGQAPVATDHVTVQAAVPAAGWGA